MSNMLGDFIIYIRSSLFGVPPHRYQAKVAPETSEEKLTPYIKIDKE